MHKEKLNIVLKALITIKYKKTKRKRKRKLLYYTFYSNTKNPEKQKANKQYNTSKQINAD